MKNTTLGKMGTIITGLGVLSFAISMLAGLYMETMFASCLSGMIIAIGFLLFMIALYSLNEDQEKKAAGLAGIGFAIIYVVLIFIVYYAETTTVRTNTGLSEETLSIISYGYIGSLFFNYDLLGYTFMSLSTFFLGSIMNVTRKSDKWLKALLMIHGVFSFCFFVPMFSVFTGLTSHVTGTILLEIWCIYLLPVCILGYKYFAKYY